ncbi:hypothetical protein QQ056_17515 [Oscillatoria laete-virens NRMC-F 0139]|nr:hypothetical protein [Oscillatoria laete-virens]MDL5055333.1 hypothetical protein [Oscillatoria laete-virens NRMC-F 0139]
MQRIRRIPNYLRSLTLIRHSETKEHLFALGETDMNRSLWRIIGILGIFIFAIGSIGMVVAQDAPTPDEYGEIYDADMELVQRALGTTEGVPDIALAAFYRAGLPVSEEMAALALQCWRDKVCDTGTGGEVVVALADGFGENVWREVTHMELILQALTILKSGASSTPRRSSTRRKPSPISAV